MQNNTGNVKPRYIQFKVPKQKERYWFNQDVIKTLHANTLTASVPYGEQFFIGCVFPHLNKIKDRALKRDAIDFIKQEANHSKAHFRLFWSTVKPHYPKLKVKGKLYQKLFWLITFIGGPKVRLASVAAMEHYTAVTGALYIREPELLAGIDRRIFLLWQWHFLEEIEHKAIAFDILQSVSKSYLIRCIGFFVSGFFLLMGYVSIFWDMAITDKLYLKPSFYWDALQFFWGKSGIMRRLAIPYLRYLLPSFHPNEMMQDKDCATLTKNLTLLEEELSQLVSKAPSIPY